MNRKHLFWKKECTRERIFREEYSKALAFGPVNPFMLIGSEECKQKTEAAVFAITQGLRILNKNESRALRRICSKNGLTPDQVMVNAKYLKELAQTAGREIRLRRDRMQNDPERGMTPDQSMRYRFSKSHQIAETNKHFERLYAAHLRWNEEQKVLRRLSMA